MHAGLHSKMIRFDHTPRPHADHAVLCAVLGTWTSLSHARRVSSPCVFSSANWAASLASAGSGRRLRQLQCWGATRGQRRPVD